MSTNRFILIFLGFIFLVIVILASNRFSGVIRSRLGKFLPGGEVKTAQVTPIPQLPVETPTPTLTEIAYAGKVPGEIPATGPENLVFLLLGGSFLVGLSLRKINS